MNTTGSSRSKGNKFTLEIDDETLADWGPVWSTFLFNSESPPKIWGPDSYRTGLLIQPGAFGIIDRHVGDHSVNHPRGLRVMTVDPEGKRTPLFISRSHFEELGIWVNIMSGNLSSETKELLRVKPESYRALFGSDGKQAPHRESFTPCGGGITIWPEAPEPSEETEGPPAYCEINVLVGGNTPQHAWYRFRFEMIDPEVTFFARDGVRLPDELSDPFLLAPTTQEKKTQWPSLLVEGYGIPPGGDGQEPPPRPGTGG